MRVLILLLFSYGAFAQQQQPGYVFRAVTDTTFEWISPLALPVNTATQSALDGKSATNHNHTGVYQPVGSYLVAADIAGKANTANPAFTGAVSTTGSIGYATGAGGTVTQATNKSTGVTLNKITGDITLNNAALAAATIVSFTLTNSTIAATDQILVQHQSTGTFGAYTITGRTANGSAVISIRNNTAGSLSEAIVIKFTVIKSVTN